MFKFFPDDDNNDCGTPPQCSTPVALVKSEETLIGDRHLHLARSLKSCTPVKLTPSTTLSKCVNLTELQHHVSSGKVAEILQSTSDLQSGVYEGGFKTWECTFDLFRFLEQHFHAITGTREEDADKMRPFHVLDLGCGSGLLGLGMLLLSSGTINVSVDFHDYNAEVLDHVTIPNLLLNFDDETASRCRFFSGDWSTFATPRQYDLILSSETIYNLDYFDRFVNLVRTALKPHGTMYLAAKVAYFGVGGGTRAFLSMINNQEELEGEVVLAIKEGVHREIVRVRRKAL